jgi:uncharacterized protein YndB with AHSA1/START domain
MNLPVDRWRNLSRLRNRRALRHRCKALRARMILLLVCAVAVSVVARAQTPQGPDATVLDTSYDAPDGTRVLRQSLVIPATLEEVWTLLTTSDGLQTWAAPFARIDFKLGGIWESSYRLDANAGDPANIRNRVLAYQPLRMIAIQAIQAPPGFPHPELLPTLWSVIELEPMADRQVRVTVSGIGYRDRPDYAKIYHHFELGNAWTLKQLYKRSTERPTDWTQVLPPVK